MRNRNATILIILFAAALHGLALLNLPLIPKNDSVWYLGLTHAVSSGQVFDPYATGVPEAFDVHYTVGYPLFLDLLLALFGWARLAIAVLVIQHLAVLGSIVCLHRLGVLLGRPGAGLLAAGAYALYFPALYYSHLMISESLFIFLSLASTVFLVAWARAPSERSLLWSGIFIGLALLVRPVALVQAGLFAGFLLVAAPWRERFPWRRLTLFALAPALLLAFNLAHNRVAYDRLTWSDAGGRHLVDRVWGFDKQLDSEEPNTLKVLEHCRASGLPFTIPGVWWLFYKSLRVGSDLSAPEADALLGRAARATILAHPFEYLANTPVAIWRILTDPDTWPPPLEQTLMPAAFERYLDVWTRPPADAKRVIRSQRAIEGRQDFRRRVTLPNPEGSAQQRWWLVQWRDHTPVYDGALVALALLLSGGLLARWGRREDLVPALVIIAAILPAALFEYPFPRYRQPAVPFMLLVLASAAVEVSRRVRPPTKRDPTDPD